MDGLTKPLFLGRFRLERLTSNQIVVHSVLLHSCKFHALNLVQAIYIVAVNINLPNILTSANWFDLIVICFVLFSGKYKDLLKLIEPIRKEDSL